MEVSTVKLVYFSPTGTTRKVLEGIAKGTGIETIEHLNMTLPDADSKSVARFTNELVVIGAPVYAGRLADDAVKRFKQFQAKNTPAVVVVLYGNRDYEDALLELQDLSKEVGFIPISGGAFIGEHSYSTQELPIAGGRPDEKDMEAAVAFGKAIMQKVSDIQTFENVPALNIPGNTPYKDGMPPMTGSPITLEDSCTTCGICADVCPTAAVTVDDQVETDEALCIFCCACVKECPTEARIMDNAFIKEITKWLHESFSERKEPETFI